MTMNPDTLHPTPFPWRKTLLAAALAAGFAASAPVGALPVGPQVVAGTASVLQNGAALTIQNSASAILDWQRFGIAAGESVRFLQPSASSSVLNRVLGNDPSQLLGQLTSNGRVWLVNPAGILVGPGARIDTAGFVASTLNVRNEDFLAGRLTFQNTPGAGSLVNRGSITTTAGGSVYLVAPEVSNEGLITTPQGETLLAAGQKIELIDTATPGVKVEITGEAGKVTNLGQIATDAGRIGMVGALVKNSGKLDASSVVREGGRIFLKARQETFVEGEGQLAATGKTGGTIDVQGHHVAVTDQARIDASGEAGGGLVRVGGDYRGGNPEIQNAAATWFGPQASIRADAKTEGQGGRVILWGNDATRAHGHISAQGAAGGKGGFVETSGHFLDTAGIDLKMGAGGEWLLDPYDITIIGNTDNNITGSPNFTATGISATLNTATVEGLLNAGTSVSVDTTGGGGQPGNIDINTTTISKTAGGDATLTLKAHNDISFSQGNISSTAGKLNVVLMADQFGSGTTGVVSKDSTSSVSTNGGNLTASGKRIDWDATATTNTGAGTVWFKPSVSATPIGIVSSKSTGFELTPTELGVIATTGVLRIGDTNAGNLSVDANPSASNAAALSLESGGTVTQSAPITASKLAVVAWGDVTLDNTGNMVSDVAAQVGNASNLNRNFTFMNYSALNVGSNINGISGINIQTSGVYNVGSPDGVIVLKNTMSSPITQSAGATLAGKAVYAEGTRVTLTEANPTGVIAGKATGAAALDAFQYKSSNGIQLSEVNGFKGVQTNSTIVTSGYGVELEGSGIGQDSLAKVVTGTGTGLKVTTSGAVTLNEGTNAFSKFQTAGTPASVNVSNSAALVLAGVSTNNGAITVDNGANSITVDGSINSGTGDIQMTASAIALGGAAAANVSGNKVKLEATNSISSTNIAGNSVTSTADLTLKTDTLSFVTPKPTLTAPRLSIRTSTDDRPITVGTTCNGAVTPNCLVVDPATMTLSVTDLVIGNSTVGDSDTTGDMYIDSALSNPSNKIILLGNGKVVQTAGITAGTLAVKSNGTTNLNVAGNAFTSVAVNNSAGGINLKNSQNTTVITLTGSAPVPTIAGLNAVGGAVVLDVTGNITLNAPAESSLSGPGTAVTLAASGGFTKSGSGAITLTGTGSPRWLVYASSPTAVTKGGLTSGFREYNKTYPTAPSNTTDNGFVYASSGSAVQVNTILSSGSASHTYGSSPTAVFGYTLTGIDAEDVTGTPVYNPAVSSSTAAGSYTVQYASGLTTSQAAFSSFLPFIAGSGLSYTVSPAPVVVNTVSAALTGNVSKVYDGTTAATLTPANFVLSGFVGGDSATVTKTSGTYGSKNAGSNLPVYVSLAYGDFAPGGSTSLANYSLPGSASGNIGSITPAALTVAGATAQDKVYDATTVATLNLASATLNGLIGNDVVTLPASGQGSFADKNVGTAKPVTPGQISLTGADAGNYSVGTLANVTASITPAAISAVSGIRAMDKKYDGK
ncbi:MAG: filamentous hemagglutinin N-terminal domain-containing protein, partial [Sterolibacterium sp.]|nr:filamentous hemagglutinin N-terminal domain-containing protein [Sterolibacterium sp.]